MPGIEDRAEELGISKKTYDPINLVTGKSFTATEGYEEAMLITMDNGVRFVAKIPKKEAEKTMWVRGLMAKIEKSEEDVATEPLIAQQFKEMQSILMNLKEKQELYNEVEARLGFLNAYAKFEGTRDVEFFVKEMASKVDFKQLNFLLSVPEIRAFLTYYQKEGHRFDRVNKDIPEISTLEKAHDKFRKKAREDVNKEAEKYGLDKDSPNLDWAARLAERFWQITGSRVTQMWTGDIAPEDRMAEDEDEWEEEKRKSTILRKPDEKKRPKNKNEYYYTFAPGIATGNDVLRKVLRMKEWCLFEDEAPNLQVIWHPLMDNVDLGQRDFISQIITRDDYIFNQMGEDLLLVLMDEKGKPCPIVFLPPDLPEKEFEEKEEEYKLRCKKIYKDARDKYKKTEDYKNWTKQHKNKIRIDFSSNKVNWNNIDFMEAIQGSTMGHWAATRIAGVDNARKALMEKPDSFLRTPTTKSLAAPGDVFNYLKGSDEEEDIGKALEIKKQLLNNFACFLELPKARELGMLKPNKAGLDTMIQRAALELGLSPETADNIARERLGEGVRDNIALLLSYFPVDKAFVEFLWGFLLEFLKVSFSTK